MTLGQSILSKTNLKRWIVKCKGDTKQNDLRFQSFLAMQHFTEQNVMWLNHLNIRIEFVATLISGVKNYNYLSKDSWYISSSRRLPLGVIRLLAALRSSSRSFLSAPLSQNIFTWLYPRWEGVEPTSLLGSS